MTKEPLQRLMEKDYALTGAVCALAFVAPDPAEIKATLEQTVFQDEDGNPLAALGLGQLAALGEKFDESFRSKLLGLATKNETS